MTWLLPPNFLLRLVQYLRFLFWNFLEHFFYIGCFLEGCSLLRCVQCPKTLTVKKVSNVEKNVNNFFFKSELLDQMEQENGWSKFCHHLWCFRDTLQCSPVGNSSLVYLLNFLAKSTDMSNITSLSKIFWNNCVIIKLFMLYSREVRSVNVLSS